MTANEYQKLAMATLNPALTRRDMLLDAALGLNGESGEVADILKKHLMQGHPFDREHLARELGDVAWYLAEAAEALDMPLEDILRMNVDKLRRRYPQGFDVEKSIHREPE